MANRGGRPSKYRPEFCDQATRLYRLGLTEPEVAKYFGVALNTLAAWEISHPEFRDATRAGKVDADADVVAALYKRATGFSHPAVKIMQNAGVPVIVDYTEQYPPDTMAIMYWLNNRRRSQWRRSPDPNGGEDDLPPTKVVLEVRDGRRPERRKDADGDA